MESRLRALRAKTDADLVRYVTNRLRSGIRMALQPDHESYRGAEETCAEVARLLPVIDQVPEVRRRELEARLDHLCELLRVLPAMTQAAG